MPAKDNYLTDPDLTSMPWLSSPLAQALINEANLTESWKYQCRQFAERGYITLDLRMSPTSLANIIANMERFADSEYKEHFYDKDADHPRYFDLWRKSEYVCNLARHISILDALQILYRRKALPFQTINFKAASEQMPHSDFIHFACTPERWVAGVAVYLEDVNESNGPFLCYPGSHKLPLYHLNDLGLCNPSAANIQEIYRSYEEFMQALILSEDLEAEEIYGPAGTAIIFDANILHGGAAVLDKDTTRLSQVTHYYFEGTYNHYCPLFSDSHALAFAPKDMSTKDILGHKFDEEV